MKKKIIYISGTRADFGIMLPVLQAIEKSTLLHLELFVTGEHLMPELGKTIVNVKRYFPKALPIQAVISKDDVSGLALFGADFFKKVVDVLVTSKPDVVLVLGDRIEMLCVASVCLYLGIPVAHVHGGEKTGTVDEIARHAITKLSHIHFTATKNAALRIRKMGEEVKRIHVVGAPALDTILHCALPNRKEIFNMLKLSPKEKFILVVQHPASEYVEKAGKQMKITLDAVKSFAMPTVIIYPHADAGGRNIIKEIEKEKNNPLFKIFKSLDHKIFLGLQKEASVIVGNSSAAIIESGSFNVPVVNIGKRQEGREQSGNVINVGYNKKGIVKALERSLYDKKHLKKLEYVKNIWGDGRASKRIVSTLEKLSINEDLLHKRIEY